jgi:hypothetical protein
MPVPADSVPVEVGQLRELLSVDRHSAGEARRAERQLPLTTVAYSMPWRIQARRRWRSDRRLRVASWSSCLVAAAAVVLWQVPLWSSANTLVGEPHSSVVARTRVLSVPVGAEQLAGAASAPSRELPAATPTGEPHSLRTASLSAQRRLQRADLWLDVGTERGAREARSLLESALAELPRSAHGQAALAQACLLLRDQSCARAAIDKATQARPWRAGYRVLSRQIDAVFVAGR